MHEEGEPRDRLYRFEGGKLTPPEMGDFWMGMAKKYPIISLEDIHAQDDPYGWKYTTEKVNGTLQLVGDDLFCTNKKLLIDGMVSGQANSILIKLNQNGTVSGTLDVMKAAMDNGYKCMVSHRSGLGMDSFMADLSVLAGEAKAGSYRERFLIYNWLIYLEAAHGLEYAGMSAFSKPVQAYWNRTWGTA